MVSDDTTDAKLGPMTLAIAKDSGWYIVDMGMAEHFFWGKNEGCHIFENTCSTVNVSEFCTSSGVRKCSDDHMYLTSCSETEFTGSCPINLQFRSCKVHHEPNEQYYSYGHDSVCLEMKVI